jgi:hypothetical protein
VSSFDAVPDVFPSLLPALRCGVLARPGFEEPEAAAAAAAEEEEEAFRARREGESERGGFH